LQLGLPRFFVTRPPRTRFGLKFARHCGYP
jgi:hypothetical protein